MGSISLFRKPPFTMNSCRGLFCSFTLLFSSWFSSFFFFFFLGPSSSYFSLVGVPFLGQRRDVGLRPACIAFCWFFMPPFLLFLFRLATSVFYRRNASFASFPLLPYGRNGLLLSSPSDKSRLGNAAIPPPLSRLTVPPPFGPPPLLPPCFWHNAQVP